jgi:hypothetical protein
VTDTDLFSKEEMAAVHAITRQLRAAGWYPSRDYLCGCTPTGLCPIHAERRAVDHYHPETITARPRVERVCQLPDCGCDGRWHA